MSHPAVDRPVQLPEGVLWRRAETQITTRLGVHPGDRVVVLAPPERDLAASLAARQTRIRVMQMGRADRRPFGWATPGGEGVGRVACDIFDPPVAEETLDALVMLFPVPLLDLTDHERLVAAWTSRLQPFGKWFSLLALDGPRDERLATTEAHLKEEGFEKVRSMRLALGRMGAALYLQTARWPGMEDEEE